MTPTQVSLAQAVSVDVVRRALKVADPDVLPASAFKKGLD